MAISEDESQKIGFNKHQLLLMLCNPIAS